MLAGGSQMMCRGARALIIALAVIVTAGLAGCAQTALVSHNAKRLKALATGPAPVGRFKVGSPYQIKGVWYYPKEVANYTETGIASWYGPNFHGKKTANGEIFDQNEVSAAHRTLPMPSVVQVTNLVNGRSMVIRVNDRGPFAHGRIIDLSKRAAQLLGFKRQGTARVRVTLMATESARLKRLAKAGRPSPLRAATGGGAGGPAPQSSPRLAVSARGLKPLSGSVAKPPTAVSVPAKKAGASIVDMTRAARQPQLRQTQPRKTRLFVQAGAFANAANADKLRQRLEAFGRVAVSPAVINGKRFYRVRIGPLSGVGTGDQVLARVIDVGYPGARLVVD